MSSFVKIKKDESVEIAGVRTSIRNGQITSTGSDSLDFVIGGGIEVSSIVLIGKKMRGKLNRSNLIDLTGEDKYGRHTNVLTKLFLADGFHHQHKIYFANLDDDPKEIVSRSILIRLCLTQVFILDERNPARL